MLLKIIYKINHSFVIKLLKTNTLSKLGIEENFLNLIESLQKNLGANIKCKGNGGIFFNVRNIKNLTTTPNYSTLSWMALANSVR